MSDEALVLRQFAALRRHGSSAAEALNQLLQGLPPGPTHEACALASRALMNPGPPPEDRFVRVLSNPTGTGEEADNLASSLEASADARDALRSTTLLFQLAVSLPLLALASIGWLGPRGYFNEFGALPGATAAFFSIVELMRWAGVPLALAAWWALGRFSRAFAPGVAAFEKAARVLERANGGLTAADFAELRLSPVEQQVLLVLRGHHEPTALRTLGDELSREGRAAVATFRAFAPVVLAVLAVQFALSVLIALYLPIFSIAGSIK